MEALRLEHREGGGKGEKGPDWLWRNMQCDKDFGFSPSRQEP